MKHLQNFNGFNDATNEKFLSIFKSDDAKGFAIATQDNNFKLYVQQALDPRSGRDGKQLPRTYEGIDLSDLSKADFLRFAEIMKDNDYRDTKFAVKSDVKLQKILTYICKRGVKTGAAKSSGTKQYGRNASDTEKYEVNKDFDPISAVNSCRERSKEPQKELSSKKELAPESKLESRRYRNKKRGF